MELDTILGIIVVIPTFYLIGRWLDSLGQEKPHQEKNPELKFVRQEEVKKPQSQITIEINKLNGALVMIFLGIVILLSFIFLVEPLENFADLEWEDGWLNILKIPFTFLFGVAPIVLLLWPILGIALIIEGYKEYKKIK